MIYSVFVVYYYKDKEGIIGIANDILRFDFLPDTRGGILKIREYLMEETGYPHVAILNMIPLATERKTTDYDEDDM